MSRFWILAVAVVASSLVLESAAQEEGIISLPVCPYSSGVRSTFVTLDRLVYVYRLVKSVLPCAFEFQWCLISQREVSYEGG